MLFSRVEPPLSCFCQVRRILLSAGCCKNEVNWLAITCFVRHVISRYVQHSSFQEHNGGRQTLTGLRKEECLGTATTVTQVLLNTPFTSFLVVLSERSYTLPQHYPFHSYSLTKYLPDPCSTVIASERFETQGTNSEPSYELTNSNINVCKLYIV